MEDKEKNGVDGGIKSSLPISGSKEDVNKWAVAQVIANLAALERDYPPQEDVWTPMRAIGLRIGG